MCAECRLNDEMSENFADAVKINYEAWASESGVLKLDFTYGVLYGTYKQSNKKDWHILRNIDEKLRDSITISPENHWTCQFFKNNIRVDVSVRVGIDWWTYLGGEFCFIEVFTALIRSCIAPGIADQKEHPYLISDLNDIISFCGKNENFNVSLLQRSQIPWLFLIAKHFCDELTS